MLRERIGYYIGFTRMVTHTDIIIIEELKPSSLAKIQFFLGEHIFKTLIVVNIST